MYQNFRDPAGLVGRMLWTANYESSWPLLQATATAVLKPLDAVAARWEPTAVEASANYPQLLMVASPRSGSTLVSQVLVQQLDVSYFPNVSAMFPSAPIWSSQRWMGKFSTAPTTLRSCYGNTPGWRGINDGFHIWNRWFGEDRYRSRQGLGAEQNADLRTFFANWHATFPKPLVNKNNRNLDGIGVLADALPNAFFVVVQRDPVMIVQSLLRARKFIQGNEHRGWGLFSSQADELDPIEATCQQVGRIFSRTQEQLRLVPAHRYTFIDYDTFCGDPDNGVEQIVGMVPALSLRSGKSSFPTPLTSSHRCTLTLDQQRQVEQALARYLPADQAACYGTAST